VLLVARLAPCASRGPPPGSRLCRSPPSPASRRRDELRYGRPQHLLDALRAGCQHHQPVEAERDA
jgi:hypothetical protein